MGDLKGFPSFKIKEENISVYTLANSNASNTAGQIVKLGSGILCATVNDSRTNSVIGLKFKVYNADGVEVADTVHYMISDKMFDKCNLAAGATMLASGDAQSNTLINTTSFSVTEHKNEVWLNAYADTIGNTVKIDTFNIN